MVGLLNYILWNTCKSNFLGQVRLVVVFCGGGGQRGLGPRREWVGSRDVQGVSPSICIHHDTKFTEQMPCLVT